MTDFYVRKTGSDAAAGTSAATAWLTVGKAVNTGTSMATGDTCYVGAGVYRISAALAPVTFTTETFLLADTDGRKTGDAGEVVITAHATNDTTAAGSIRIFDFSSKNYWTIRGFTLVGGLSNPVIFTTGTSHDLKFQDLTMFPKPSQQGTYMSTHTWQASQPMNMLVERCRVWNPTAGVPYQVHSLPVSATGADVDQNIIFRNCMGLAAGNASVFVTGVSANTYKSGGVRIYNGFFIGSGIQNGNANLSATYPTTIYNCFIAGTGTGINGVSGANITEDYNYTLNPTGVGTFVNAGTKGANTVVNFSYDSRILFGQEYYFGKLWRPFGMWPLGSPMLDWGDGASGAVTDDLLGGPRPGHGGASVTRSLGPLERNDVGIKETTTVRTGSNAIKIAGPGYHDFMLPVSAASTTVTVYGRYDGTYAGTKPSMSVRNGGEAGVADATATMTGLASTWEQLSLTFTPTSAGIVTLRLLSSSTAAGGSCFFDDFAVT